MKKVVLVTGASSGMGRETALQLLKEGCIVYGGARRTERMKDIEEAGGYAMALDVTDDTSMVGCVKGIIEKEGRIDVLINNAGYGSYGSVEEVPIEEAKRQFEVNLFGLARMTQLVLPHMREQRFGKIVNISSMGGKIYTPLGAWYHATKHALEGWSDCLRYETKSFGIDVIIIEPGGVQTEWGGIAVDTAAKRSGNGPYKPLFESFKGVMERHGKQAHPSVIARLISRSLKARRPKTRYVAGTMAKPMLFMRKILSDRGFDRMLQRFFK